FTYVAGGATESLEPREDYSTRLWKTADAVPRFVEGGELDATRAADRRLLDAGMQSVVVAPLRSEAATVGVLILAAPILKPVAAFLAIAVERERLWAIEQTRHRRRVRLEAMLPKVAESLDVRQAFGELSTQIQEVIPHDVLAFW